MDMMFILYILVVNRIGTDTIGLMSCTEECDEFVLELTREFSDGLTGFRTDCHHLTEVGFGSGVCLP